MNVPSKISFCIPSIKYDGIDSIVVTPEPAKFFNARKRDKNINRLYGRYSWQIRKSSLTWTDFKENTRVVTINNGEFKIDLQKIAYDLLDITEYVPREENPGNYRILLSIRPNEIIECVVSSGYVSNSVINGNFAISFRPNTNDGWKFILDDSSEQLEKTREIVNVIENNKKTSKWIPGHRYAISPTVSVLYFGSLYKYRSPNASSRAFDRGAFYPAYADFWFSGWEGYITMESNFLSMPRLCYYINNDEWDQYITKITEGGTFTTVEEVLELLATDDIYRSKLTNNKRLMRMNLVKSSYRAWDLGKILDCDINEITLDGFLNKLCDNYFLTNPITEDVWVDKFSVLGLDKVLEEPYKSNILVPVLKKYLYKKARYTLNRGGTLTVSEITSKYLSSEWPFTNSKDLIRNLLPEFIIDSEKEIEFVKGVIEQLIKDSANP